MHIPIYSIGMVLFPFKLKGYVMEVMCVSTIYPVELAVIHYIVRVCIQCNRVLERYPCILLWLLL